MGMLDTKGVDRGQRGWEHTPGSSWRESAGLVCPLIRVMSPPGGPLDISPQWPLLPQDHWASW